MFSSSETSKEQSLSRIKAAENCVEIFNFIEVSIKLIRRVKLESNSSVVWIYLCNYLRKECNVKRPSLLIPRVPILRRSSI